MAAAALAFSSLSGCSDKSAASSSSQEAGALELGLFSSLPIYWGEEQDLGSLLDNASLAGPVRRAFEQEFTLVPLDALEADNLAPLQRLVLAQPRPLAPSENLALDNWVRAGGNALVFADPLLTAHSAFALGDRRRPQDVVLMSPILARWGLELRYDEDQAPGRRNRIALGIPIAVEMAGSFALRGGVEGTECTLSGDALVAQCRIGAGRATLIADAAILDFEGGHVSDSDATNHTQTSVIGRLLALAFER